MAENVSAARPGDPVDVRGGDWLDDNRATWNERVPLHLEGDFYDSSALLAGRGRLLELEEEALARRFPDGFEGLRVLHLQCHFGADTLVFAQRGAEVVGLDFSQPAITAARELAATAGLADRARFVVANLYDARHLLPQPGSFDLVYTSWGTIGWLPDVAEWARIVAWFLKPGGRFFFADSHPAAWVFDDAGPGELPRFAYPYDDGGVATVEEQQGDYADESAVLENPRTWEWTHPLSSTLGGLLDAGLRLDRLGEHYELPWRMFHPLVRGDDGLWRWPERRWLPLAVTLEMTLPA
ncbi:class I SAM-dependent methyltransferase [Herbiconiux liukaitaii]|uniref:class I SAM-dependent methyltransferase n=1 Tax=Herbiconiux liukaitaii TaxID=3342799 RepID=UPI0035B7EEEE